MAKFASKFDLTLHDFNDIVKSHERKQRRLSNINLKNVDETLSKVVVAKKAAPKKTAKVVAKKATTASRVKKPFATKAKVIKPIKAKKE